MTTVTKILILLLAGVFNFVHGYGLVSWIHKCNNMVTASCCDLVESPASLNNEHLRVPHFADSIWPNMAFTERSDIPLVLVSDLGDFKRGSVWDATSDKCIDGDVGCGSDWPDTCKMWLSPSPCWRYEPYSTSFPGFALSRCNGETYQYFSINLVGPLMYWDGTRMSPSPNKERMRVSKQEWPNPGELMSPLNENMAPKWAAVLGSSILTPTDNDVVVSGSLANITNIEWTSAGLSKTGMPLSFESSFSKKLNDDDWQDDHEGFQRFNDQEFYSYSLVDQYGNPCTPSTCTAGTYYLRLTVDIDGVTSNEVHILFASGLDDGYKSRSTQSAYGYLAVENEQLMGKRIADLEKKLEKADFEIEEEQKSLDKRVQSIEDEILLRDKKTAKSDANLEANVSNLEQEIISQIEDSDDPIGVIAFYIASLTLMITLLLSIKVVFLRPKTHEEVLYEEEPTMAQVFIGQAKNEKPYEEEPSMAQVYLGQAELTDKPLMQATATQSSNSEASIEKDFPDDLSDTMAMI